MNKQNEPRISLFMVGILTISGIMALVNLMWPSSLHFIINPMLEVAPDVRWSTGIRIFIWFALSGYYIAYLPIVIFPLQWFLKNYPRTQILLLGLQFLLMVCVVTYIIWGVFGMQNEMMMAGGIT